MKLAAVKTTAQYQEYLARIEELVTIDPSAQSEEGEELELLAILVEDYESKKFAFDKPDPVEAVQFRMLEQDLKQVDLVPYFGSRSRVSEFLSRRRSLTVSVIRNLSSGLGIPTDVLVNESVGVEAEGVEQEFDWSKFPIEEMIRRRWIAASKRKNESAEASVAVKDFIEKALGGVQQKALARRTIRGDAFSWSSSYSLVAWQARVLQKASENRKWREEKFDFRKLTDEFVRNLVRLSPRATGIAEAVEYLRAAGIAVIIEGHLAKTKLDGAAMLASNGNPVIGLTLRFDRIDSFWFTLMHELAHICKHLSNPGEAFLDRLADVESTADIEKEADRWARDWLIPRAVWKTAAVRQYPTKEGIVAFAREVGVHPAIVAGRIRKESDRYTVFTDLLGQGKVSRSLRNDSK